MRKKPQDYDYSELKTIIENSESITQVIQKIGKAVNNGSYQQIRKIAAYHGLELPKWDNRKSTNYAIRKNTLTTEEFFIKGKSRSGVNIRAKLLALGWTYKCYSETCDLKGKTTWGGKPIVFQVDHIDGDRFNNTLENLRFLCPNCHTLTETYSRKNLTRYSYCVCGRRMQGEPQAYCIHSEDGTWDDSKCVDCGNPRSRRHLRCNVCEGNRRTASGEYLKINFPPVKEVIKNVEDFGYSQYSKILGISDNGIRKYLVRNKVHPLPKKKTKKERKIDLLSDDNMIV